jgi:hypothetical protein
VLLRWGALLVALAACGPHHHGSDVDAAPPDAMQCTSLVAGDLSQPVEMQVVYWSASGWNPLADGQMLPLTSAPQGGYILVVGMRIKNAELCDSLVQVALRDPCDAHVAAFDGRSVAWTIAADGFAEPAQPTEISDYANVPACPSANLAQDIDGNAWTLEAKFFDRDQHVTTQTFTVTPTCDGNFDDGECQCECDSLYGQTVGCPTDPDGGVPAC